MSDTVHAATYYLTQACFVLSNVPLNSAKYGVLWLRAWLVGAFVCLCAFTSTVSPSDQIQGYFFCSLFVVINGIHAIVILYRLRPIQFDREEDELIYRHVFARHGQFQRWEFKELLSLSKSLHVQKNHLLTDIGDRAEYVGLLVAGAIDKIIVTEDNQEIIVNTIYGRYSGFEKDEWSFVCTNEFFSRSETSVLRRICKEDNTVVLVWPIDKLCDHFKTHSETCSKFRNLCAWDLIRKLQHSNDKIQKLTHDSLCEGTKNMLPSPVIKSDVSIHVKHHHHRGSEPKMVSTATSPHNHNDHLGRQNRNHDSQNHQDNNL
eukprot:PhF_6_TR15047/c0_g1_i4/m.23619/K21108/BVES; blood vessel epicardial substance